jgi:hypothetical protein
LYLKATENNFNKAVYIEAAICSSLLALTHFFSLIIYLSISICILLQFRKSINRIIKLTTCFIIPGLLSVPSILASIQESVPNLAAVKASSMIWTEASFWMNSQLILFDLGVLSLAAVGFVLLYKRHRKAFQLLVCWASFPLIIPLVFELLGIPFFYTRPSQFSIAPIMLASSCAFAINSNAVKITKINEITKSKRSGILLMALITLIILANVTMAYRLSGRVENDGKIRWGEYAAIEWIRSNTEPNATIITDFPLASWTEVLTQRKVISGYHLLGAISTKNLLDLYKDTYAFTVSNFFIERGFIQVYDQGPFGWTNAPMVAIWSYDEGNFIPSIWIDNEYSSLNSLSLSGAFSEGYASPNYTMNILGSNVSKFVVVGEKDVLIHYNFTRASDITLAMYVNPEISSSVEAVRFENETVAISGSIPIQVMVGKAKVSVTKDLVWNLVRIDLKYENVSNISLNICAIINGSIPSDTYFATHRLIIDRYDVDYAVLWKHGENVATSMFNRMYYKVFENTDVAIYDVRKIIDTPKMSSST